jgi:hypothetical protein
MVKSVPEECWRRFLPRIPRKEILAGAQNPELVLVGEPGSGAEAFARGGASKNPGSGPRVGEKPWVRFARGLVHCGGVFALVS